MNNFSQHRHIGGTNTHLRFYSIINKSYIQAENEKCWLYSDKYSLHMYNSLVYITLAYTFTLPS